MTVFGIPKEIKPLEKRVGLTPSCVQALTQKGARVLVESSAGRASGFTDSDYEKAGGVVLDSAKKVYAGADVVLKVKEPQAAEFECLKPGQMLFGYLHLASPDNCGLIKVLQDKKITAIGFETLESGGRLPLLAPMSEIAGGLAAAYAAFYRKNPDEQNALYSLEEIAAQFPDFHGLASPGNVVIWGGGVAGQAALHASLKLGASVSVIEKSPEKRNQLRQWTTKVFDPSENTDEVLNDADVFIGSVHVRGMRALRVLTPEKLEKISRLKRKVIMDISIDQGGNFPESRPTTYHDPVFRDSNGNLRFCVANMPSLCGRAASQMLSGAVLPYVLKMAQGLDKVFQDEDLSRAVNLRDGKILLPEINQAHYNTASKNPNE